MNISILSLLVDCRSRDAIFKNSKVPRYVLFPSWSVSFLDRRLRVTIFAIHLDEHNSYKSACSLRVLSKVLAETYENCALHDYVA